MAIFIYLFETTRFKGHFPNETTVIQNKNCRQLLCSIDKILVIACTSLLCTVFVSIFKTKTGNSYYFCSHWRL